MDSINMNDIPEYKSCTKIEPITKGWSNDKKYYIETETGKRMLLRISDMTEYNIKKAEYEMLERVYTSGVPTSMPCGFGFCNDGKNCYSLTSWIEGEDLEQVLPLMSEAEQYEVGTKAGKILRKIHSIPIPDVISDWGEKYFAVIDERVDAYRSNAIPFEGNEFLLEYFAHKRFLLDGRPQCVLHGDFHEENLMISPNNELFVIDFLDEGFGNCGDSWYDFKTFGENDNVYFSTGFIRGYFDGEPPQEFWDILTYYIATAGLTAILWVKYHKPDELPDTLSWNETNVRCLKAGFSPLMKWYLKNFNL